MKEYARLPSIAVVGTGYWGKNLVRNFDALGVLGAVCDAESATVDAFVAQYPKAKGVTSFGQLLIDPDINAVAIATPASTHAQMVHEALLANKDVYVEKPLCLSEDHGKKLLALAEERARVLMVGHLLWYHPAVLALKQLIHDGELGRIRYIYSNRLNMGKLRREENVLWSFAPHDVSVVLGLVGEMPESVQANGGYFLHQHIADTTVTLLDFASGVRAHIFVSWLHPFKEQKLVVVGDKRMAVFNDTRAWAEKLQLYPHSVHWRNNLPVANKAEPEYVSVLEGEPLRAECDHFIQCIVSRASPRTDGREGLRVLRVLNACEQALASHAGVRLKEEDALQQNFTVHESAEVDPSTTIGKGTKIWHFSHILRGSWIGEKCTIGQNVMIGPDVRIGNNCKIQNNVSIYQGVSLEDDVFCGPSMVFTNVINPRSHVSRKDEFKATLVQRGATIGANATVICGHTLGEYCFVGAGAVITHDVPAHALVVGNPARRIGWMCACGARLPEELYCRTCGKTYAQHAEGLSELATRGIEAAG